MLFVTKNNNFFVLRSQFSDWDRSFSIRSLCTQSVLMCIFSFFCTIVTDNIGGYSLDVVSKDVPVSQTGSEVHQI